MADEFFTRGTDVAFDPQQEEGPNPMWEDDYTDDWWDEEDEEELVIEDSYLNSWDDWDNYYNSNVKEMYNDIGNYE